MRACFQVVLSPAGPNWRRKSLWSFSSERCWLAVSFLLHDTKKYKVEQERVMEVMCGVRHNTYRITFAQSRLHFLLRSLASASSIGLFPSTQSAHTLTHSSKLTHIPPSPPSLLRQRDPMFILQMSPSDTPCILAIISLATSSTSVHLPPAALGWISFIILIDRYVRFIRRRQGGWVKDEEIIHVEMCSRGRS